MRVTVCELPDTWTDSDLYWDRLIRHLENEQSDLLVLPEMPFSPWFCRSRQFDPAVWDAAVATHDRWMARLDELPAGIIAASRPVTENNQRLNRGFIHTRETGTIKVHDKYYLPDDEGYWEASWYDRGKEDFRVIDINGKKLGFLICTEIWFTQRARDYIDQDMDILICPRATPRTKVDIWITGGRAAAIVAGAFCLSSNYCGPNTPEEDFGGTGWIIEPDRGDVLGTTGPDRNFLSLSIDIDAAKKAKSTYPRYVKD